MDPRLLEHFNEISNILKHREEPVDIFLISSKLNISIKQSKILLNHFISQGTLLNEYRIIFSAEIFEGNTIKTILVPSTSNKLGEVLNYKDNLLDFGVFAIYKKTQNLLLNDYSVFCHENKIIQNIQVEKTVRSTNQKIIENKTNVIKNNIESKPTKPTATVVNKNPVKKPDVNQSNLALKFNNKLNISKEKVNEIKTTFQEVETNPDDNYCQENYYGGPPTKIEDIQLPVPEKRKRVEEREEIKETKKKRDVHMTDVYNNANSSDSDGEPKINSVKAFDEDKEGVTHKDDSTQLKKIKKTRKIKKTNTYRDEKGYLRTIDEWEDEEYWTDEKPKIVPNQQSFNNNNNVGKKPAGKKVAAGQSNLFSFFGK